MKEAVVTGVLRPNHLLLHMILMILLVLSTELPFRSLFGVFLESFCLDTISSKQMDPWFNERTKKCLIYLLSLKASSLPKSKGMHKSDNSQWSNRNTRKSHFQDYWWWWTTGHLIHRDLSRVCSLQSRIHSFHVTIMDLFMKLSIPVLEWTFREHLSH